MPLPPLLAAAVQAAATATLATANPGLCSTLLRRHPEHVATAYQWLQPAFAPLEPLLWGTGVDAEHPSRRCHCGEGYLESGLI